MRVLTSAFKNMEYCQAIWIASWQEADLLAHMEKAIIRLIVSEFMYAQSRTALQINECMALSSWFTFFNMTRLHFPAAVCAFGLYISVWSQMFHLVPPEVSVVWLCNNSGFHSTPALPVLLRLSYFLRFPGASPMPRS